MLIFYQSKQFWTCDISNGDILSMVYFEGAPNIWRHCTRIVIVLQDDDSARTNTRAKNIDGNSRLTPQSSDRRYTYNVDPRAVRFFEN